MYYALVDSRNSTDARTYLLWGSLEDIAEKLISDGRESIEWLTEDMDEDEIDEEYGEDISEFEEFTEIEELSEEDVAAFALYLADSSTEVAYLTSSYTALAEAFEEYTKDKPSLDEWQLIDEIEESEENLKCLDMELQSLTDGTSKNNLCYFIKK